MPSSLHWLAATQQVPIDQSTTLLVYSKIQKSPQTDNAAIFNVTDFGNFTANFKQVSPPIPPEYWIPLYGVIVSSIVGWSVPSIIGWMKSKKQGGRLNQYHKRINSLYDDGKLDENDIGSLDELKRYITDAYAKGKITEQHYNILNKKISDHGNNQESSLVNLLRLDNDG
jgi:hypothetical protein